MSVYTSVVCCWPVFPWQLPLSHHTNMLRQDVDTHIPREMLSHGFTWVSGKTQASNRDCREDSLFPLFLACTGHNLHPCYGGRQTVARWTVCSVSQQPCQWANVHFSLFLNAEIKFSVMTCHNVSCLVCGQSVVWKSKRKLLYFCYLIKLFPNEFVVSVTSFEYFK